MSAPLGAAVDSLRSMYRLLFSATATIARPDSLFVLIDSSESSAPEIVATSWMIRSSAGNDWGIAEMLSPSVDIHQKKGW